jgi:flagellar biosynthesis protein FlhB
MNGSEPMLTFDEMKWVIALLVAVLGTLIVVAIDVAIESYRVSRQPRMKRDERTFVPKKGADR